jgi:hypothetical protein
MIALKGTVKNGVVVLEPGSTPLPEGIDVLVQIAPAAEATVQRSSGKEGPLSEVLLKYAGTIKGLPPDFARNHDHYIHGTRKK